jgi:hypothetical protein
MNKPRKVGNRRTLGESGAEIPVQALDGSESQMGPKKSQDESSAFWRLHSNSYKAVGCFYSRSVHKSSVMDGHGHFEHMVLIKVHLKTTLTTK